LADATKYHFMVVFLLTPTIDYFRLLQLQNEVFLYVKYPKANCTLVRVFCACPEQKPCKDQWGRGLDAMEDALELEKHVYQSLLDLHTTAVTANDPQV